MTTPIETAAVIDDLDALLKGLSTDENRKDEQN